eukprot:TRINITY_DN2800_c0_g1_i2.p1 TRINITY_DN2800_c0_g1~~TRINITY_DN2800_c0_g1_i2.p1  ORF type:complete len:434 (-),score=113.83 TRINITY_DN2800_c0_g1_i2:129-1430(-)
MLSSTARQGLRRLPRSLPSVARAYSAGAGKDTFQTSTTPNGVTVVSVDAATVRVPSVGVVALAGSRFESGASRGAAHFLSHLALQSTKSHTPVAISRAVESISGGFAVVSGRESVGYFVNSVGSQLDNAVDALSEIAQPVVKEYEVRDAAANVGRDAISRNQDGVDSAYRLAYSRAFQFKGLGVDPVAPCWALDSLSAETVQAFVAANYGADRLAVVGAGVDHAELVAHVTRAFADAAASSASGANVASQYVGGSQLVEGGGRSSFAVLFEGQSGKNAVALEVARAILGQGVPSTQHQYVKDQQSRLNQNVFNSRFSSLSAVNVAHSDAGVFGVIGQVNSGVGEAVNSVRGELQAVASGKFTDDELARAVNGVRANVFRRSVQAILADTANQALANKSATSAATITKADVQNAVKKALSSQESLVVIGDVASL